MLLHTHSQNMFILQIWRKHYWYIFISQCTSRKETLNKKESIYLHNRENAACAYTRLFNNVWHHFHLKIPQFNLIRTKSTSKCWRYPNHFNNNFKWTNCAPLGYYVETHFQNCFALARTSGWSSVRRSRTRIVSATMKHKENNRIGHAVAVIQHR